jgi:hypothetical protein
VAKSPQRRISRRDSHRSLQDFGGLVFTPGTPKCLDQGISHEPYAPAIASTLIQLKTLPQLVDRTLYRATLKQSLSKGGMDLRQMGFVTQPVAKIDTGTKRIRML